MNKRYILSADIGGTHSRFGLFEFQDNDDLIIRDKIWLNTKEVNSFEELILQLKDTAFEALDICDITVIAVAGPVINNLFSSPPNIKWDIDLRTVVSKGILKNSYLINDFVAQAYSILTPAVRDVTKLCGPNPKDTTIISIIGAGTGLGKAMLIQKNSHIFALPSEGGHSYFACINRKEYEFLEFCRKKTGLLQITEDIVVSGRGIELIHYFLTNEYLSSEEITKNFKKYDKTLAWIARFYGRVCRDFVLNTLCFGGFYISGGLAARNPEIIYHPCFIEEFFASEKMSHILKQIPIYHIKNQDIGLWGAAFYGMQKLPIISKTV